MPHARTRTHTRTRARARTHAHTHTHTHTREQHTRKTVMTAKPAPRTPRLTHVARPGLGGWCALLRGETESRLSITPVHTTTQFKVHEHMRMHVILSKDLCTSVRAYNAHPSTNWHLVCLLAPPEPLNLSSRPVGAMDPIFALFSLLAPSLAAARRKRPYVTPSDTARARAPCWLRHRGSLGKACDSQNAMLLASIRCSHSSASAPVRTHHVCA